MKKGRFKSSKHWIDDEVLVLFASVVAEARYTGHYGPWGASQDLRAINRLLLHRARDERQPEPDQQRLLAKTEHLLDDKRSCFGH